MNITDIDDKTIRDSQKSGKTLKEFTEFFSEAFLTDLDNLSIVRADTIAPISTLIEDMGTMIQWLIDKWYAYLAEDGSIYYSVKKFRKYGELAHIDIQGMISSVRINNDEYEKEQVADFALWKAYDRESDGENKWTIHMTIDGEKKTLEWRPGWHIECSACNHHFFWAQIDIHMGGIDNLFPHHQNEVAQTEAFTGKEFSKYWLHGGHLLVDNKKMSKSAGNFYTLRDIVERVSVMSTTGDILPWKKEQDSPTRGVLAISLHSKWQKLPETQVYRGFRLMWLQNSYRENFNFTYERLTGAINTITGLDEMMKRLGRYIQRAPSINDERNARGKLKFHDIAREFRDNQQSYMQDFIGALEDDFDTVTAMTIVFEYQSYINSGIDDALFSLEEAKSLIDLLRSWDSVIGILDFSLLEDDITPPDIQMLLDERALAKSMKDYARWDEIRDIITDMWYRIIDEKDGARVEKM
jgi:cysteinyl-tRNA synthetase